MPSRAVPTGERARVRDFRAHSLWGQRGSHQMVTPESFDASLSCCVEPSSPKAVGGGASSFAERCTDSTSSCVWCCGLILSNLENNKLLKLGDL